MSKNRLFDIFENHGLRADTIQGKPLNLPCALNSLGIVKKCYGYDRLIGVVSFHDDFLIGGHYGANHQDTVRLLCESIAKEYGLRLDITQQYAVDFKLEGADPGDEWVETPIYEANNYPYD